METVWPEARSLAKEGRVKSRATREPGGRRRKRRKRRRRKESQKMQSWGMR